MRKYIIGILILGLLGGYFYISGQEKLVVNEKGQVKGLGNHLRALVQGGKFWKGQLTIATGLYNKSTAPHPPSSADMRELYKMYRIALDTLDSRMEALYTPEERLAEHYRIQADSIQRAGKWRLGDEKAEAVRAKETESYKGIMTAIERRIMR
jgi:hypothetical protein